MSRPYVSIDIETTGIDDKCQILQISAVFDDLSSPVSELTSVDIPIKYEVMTHCEPYAMGMNADLLKKMMDKNFTCYNVEAAEAQLISFLKQVHERSIDAKGKSQKIIFAGKNVASFDIPKIRNFLSREGLKVFDSLIHYKTLDVGSLYYDVFKDNVSLSKINELTGRPAVSHNALDDALDVVYAVRHKLGVK